MTYAHLTLEERKKIESLIKQGFNHLETGRILKRTPNAIREELDKNGGETMYSAAKAHEAASRRRREADVKRAASREESSFSNRESIEILSGKIQDLNESIMTLTTILRETITSTGSRP